jgi:hypothetical protein
MGILKAIGELLIAAGIAALLVGLGRLFAAASSAARPGPTATPRTGTGELSALAEQALRIVEAHPEGITLVAIGKELLIDWRQLIAPINLLLAEGRVEKRDKSYFPR